MFNLHETNHYLASKAVRGRFMLPLAPVMPLTAETAHAYVDTLAASIGEALTAVTDTGEETERALAEHQRRINNALFERMHQLIQEDLGG
jgi:hypothetical protein